MANFNQEPKYNYNWQRSKFNDVSFSGSNISQFVNDAGYITSSVVVSASYALTASYLTGTVTSASYAVSASHAQTASYFAGTVTSASYARTASYVNPLNQNVTITGSLLLSSSYISQTDYIDFNTGSAVPTWKPGRIFWDNTNGALAVYNVEQDITLQVGQESWVRVRNNTGVTITNGSAVKISGSLGNRPLIILAQAVDQSLTFTNTNEIIGLATHDIEDNSDGYVTTQGLVNGLNTNVASWTEGDILYVSSSAGKLTNIRPLPPLDETPVGFLTRKNPGNGAIFVFPAQPLHFHDLSEVSASTYQQGNLWTYKASGSSGYWINSNQLSGSYGLTGNLGVTGSITIGNITSTPSTENTLNIYPPLAGGTGEGGQILLAASGGLYTSASMLDTWQNYFRILRGTNTGGSNAQLLGLDLQTGNLSIAGAVIPSAWSSGQVIKDTMLSNTEVTISTTTIATSTSDTDFLTYSYTPLSSTSYLVIHYHLASYDFTGGTGNDSYFSRIKVDGNEITYGSQSTVNGFRTGVLFPLTGRYTNSNTTAKSIVVAARRNSADDNITIVNTATSMWLRITEIAR